MSSTTVNKGYAIQSTGENSGIWGDILNADVIEVIDSNLGGIVTKGVLGSNITLTSDEAENCIIRLTGAQSADIQVTNPRIGFYFVENLTTNAFNITVTNGVSGVVVPKGRSTVIILLTRRMAVGLQEPTDFLLEHGCRSNKRRHQRDGLKTHLGRSLMSPCA